jgi:SAM-dependent methyltransferase
VHVRGLDYIPEMIRQARSRAAQVKHLLSGTLEFAVGDVTALEEPASCYDKVLATRVLINLGDWERQRQALSECARVLKPGGALLLSEATLQGWRKLNVFRKEWGLSEIPMPAFNCYLDETEVVEAARAQGLHLVELSNFSSTYFVGTRVLKPLLAKALAASAGQAVDPAAPDMEWNRWFSQLPATGDYGTQKLFIFRKAPVA